jgi:hypothetical protein
MIGQRKPPTEPYRAGKTALPSHAGEWMLGEAVNGHRFLPSYGRRMPPAAVTLSLRCWPSGLPSALSSRS